MSTMMVRDTMIYYKMSSDNSSDWDLGNSTVHIAWIEHDNSPDSATLHYKVKIGSE